MEYNDVALLVSSCDYYEDAWNPFFRLLQFNWKNCPRKVFLNTEKKDYKDEYFFVKCLHASQNLPWSDRLINCLNQIDSEYVLFFLEDFFLEGEVSEEIITAAYNCLKNYRDVGVVKFIPGASEGWYDSKLTYNHFFHPVPLQSMNKSNLMISLYRKDYFLKLLRHNESPWDFEKYGAYRANRYKEKILIQTDAYPLAFPYNYQIKCGYGISNKQWLPKNKELFNKYGIQVDFSRLGWYDPNCKQKIIGLKRSFKEKVLMPFRDPKTFGRIVKYELHQAFYAIRHFKHYF